MKCPEPDFLLFDVVRLLGKPINMECSQTSSRRQGKLKVHLTIGLAELVESLYDSRSTNQMPEFNEVCKLVLVSLHRANWSKEALKGQFKYS